MLTKNKLVSWKEDELSAIVCLSPTGGNLYNSAQRHMGRREETANYKIKRCYHLPHPKEAIVWTKNLFYSALC